MHASAGARPYRGIATAGALQAPAGLAIDHDGPLDDPVDEPVLDAAPAGVVAREVADKRLVRGRVGEEIGPDHLDKGLRLPVEPRGLQPLSVFGGLLGEFDVPHPTTPGRLRRRTLSGAPPLSLIHI